ncbi:hypothetical protein EON65_35665, partial [archaeon]
MPTPPSPQLSILLFTTLSYTELYAILQGNKSWRSILKHLGEKWAEIEELDKTLFIHYLFQEGGLSENLIEESRLDNSVWTSLQNHPVMETGNTNVIFEVFYCFQLPPTPPTHSSTQPSLSTL